MSVVPIEEAFRTYDCKIPNCDGEAAHARGPFALLCEYHKEEKRKAMTEAGRQGGQARRAVISGEALSDESFEKKARSLVAIGKRLDTAVKRYQPARTELDEAMKVWRAALAKLAGDKGDE